MILLGISAFYHDSAAALLIDGQLVAAAQEERFSRKKHDASFPAKACKYCLDYGHIDLDQIDAIVFYDKPFLKFERLLETYYGFAPRGLASFVTAIPVWLKEKLFLKKIIIEELSKLGHFDRKKTKLLFPEHHLSHAASAFYASSFQEAAILTIDGVGEWATASICHGKGREIEILKEMKFPHSLGLLYSAFTYYLGFRVNSGEYKLMGLAPYGIPDSAEVQHFEQLIRDNLLTLHDDGSIWLNQKYFTYSTGLRMLNDRRWAKLFGISRRRAESPLEQAHCNLALAIQNITEDIVLKMAGEARKLTKAENICLAGGVALNCVANGKLLRSGLFSDLFVQPAAGDAGGALGAAYAAHHIYFGQRRENPVQPDAMQGAYLGPEYGEGELKRVIRKYNALATPYNSFDELTAKVADLLHEGQAIGWFQGRMEFGPRALGNRSILGDPSNEEMQKKLNLKIKYRESFRPFAPSVTEEDAARYFNLTQPSPYMLQVAGVNDTIKEPLPADYYQLPLMERLYIKRSALPAITHIDFSARIQTVNKETNPRYWQLLKAFEQKTGTPVVVNTSFNVRGEPIVCTPEDAYRCFMRTEMDALVINNYLFIKNEQADWKKEDHWQEEFQLD